MPPSRAAPGVLTASFDEIAVLYRTHRRALVKLLVRAKEMPDKVAERITANVPKDVQPHHREKFISDVLSEIENLDASRIAKVCTVSPE
jgi:hypothetical protein